MGEDMANCPGWPPVGRGRAPPPPWCRRRSARSSRSSALRSCRRAGPYPHVCAKGWRHRHVRQRRRPRAATVSRPSAGGQRKRSASPEVMALQSSRSGQSVQAGRRGVQIVAPRSIIAWAKSPGPVAGTSARHSVRSRGLASLSGVTIAKSREITRSTLPSMTAARPVEGDRRDRRRGIVADAGQLSQASLAYRETLPPCRATSSAHFLRLRARA